LTRALRDEHGLWQASSVTYTSALPGGKAKVCHTLGDSANQQTPEIRAPHTIRAETVAWDSRSSAYGLVCVGLPHLVDELLNLILLLVGRVRFALT
jgi:hypothetical protein